MITGNVLERIKEQVKEQPEKTAIVNDGIEITYLELYKYISRIAGYLKSKAIGPEDVVAIYMERSFRSVLALLGILQAGAAFLPIDSKTPGERLLYMLKVSGVKVVFTDKTAVTQGLEQEIVGIDNLLSPDSKIEECTDVFPAEDNTLAYVIFTSGSTGRPKGAMIEHGGMNHHLSEKIKLLGLGRDSIIAHNASISFDISVWQVLTPLIAGGTLVIFSERNLYHLSSFIRILKERRVTVLEIVPTFLNLLLQKSKKDKADFESLCYILSTGEALPKELARRWLSQYNIPIINAYGPTEASDDITHCILTSKDHLDRIPIGKPISNTVFYVKNEKGEECDYNEPGELWVSGICVGRGYIGNETETNKYFTVDKITGCRLYKTGDLVSKQKDGNYIYHGRMDKQIKFHGHRIELKEIENVFLESGLVEGAAVVIEPSGNMLWACYTAPEDINITAIKQYLSQKLPEYMIPAEFLRVDQIPVNINGKVDNQKLYQLMTDKKLILQTYDEGLEKRLKGILKDMTGNQDLLKEEEWMQDLRILGFNSVTIIDFITKLENEFQTEFDDMLLSTETMYNYKHILEIIVRQMGIK